MADLDVFRSTIARVLFALAFLHVPLLALITWGLGRDPWPILLGAAACLLLPAVLSVLKRPMSAVAMALAVALVGQTSLLVFAFTGHPWQVEMHFYYFAALAMLSGFCDWRVLVVAAGLVALHHLTLDLVLPNAVYPGASDLKRVAVHAVVVVIETAMLIFIGRAIIAAFEAARRNGTDAERLAGDLHRLVAERERDLSDTVSQANAVGAAVDRFQAEIGDAVRMLQDAAAALRGNADELGAVAVQAEQRTTAAAQASGQTSQTVSAVAAAGGELAETIAAIGASASQSSELASRAVGEAEAANQTVADLGRLGNEIGDVIGLITGVAAQTNLLALNADRGRPRRRGGTRLLDRRPGGEGARDPDREGRRRHRRQDQRHAGHDGALGLGPARHHGRHRNRRFARAPDRRIRRAAGLGGARDRRQRRSRRGRGSGRADRARRHRGAGAADQRRRRVADESGSRHRRPGRGVPEPGGAICRRGPRRLAMAVG